MFKNLNYKLFAFGLAIVFWIFVVSLKNAFTEFPHVVPIAVFNLGEKLAVAEIPEGVHLTLRSDNPEVFRRLQTADFEAYIDLSNIGVGEHSVSVSVTSRNPKITISRIEPEEIAVKIEPIRERIIPVSIRVEGFPVKGFEVAKKETQLSNVKVSGAESVLLKVHQAVATLTLEGNEKQNFIEKSAIKIFGVNNQPLSGLMVIPEEIEVSVELREKEQQKEVEVRPKTSGTPAAGSVKSLAVDPAVIKIQGPSELLEEISFIETEEISLAGLSESKVIQAKLKIPEGITLVEKGLKSVKVKVEIEGSS